MMPPERLLPAHPDSEIALLASCVIEPSCGTMLSCETTAATFTGLCRPKIRELLIELIPRYGKVSYSMLESEWKARGEAPEGEREIEAMRRCSVALEHWAWHLDRLTSATMRRASILRAERISVAAGNGASDQEVLSEISSLERISTEHASHQGGPRLGHEWTPLVRSERWAEKDSIVDLRMGRYFNGIRKGEVLTLLARTWVGKSLWASQAALNSEAMTLIVSLEMPGVQWWERMLGQAWGLPLREAVDRCAYGRLGEPEQRILSELEKRIALDDSCDGTFPALQAAFNRVASKWNAPPALVVIDYLQYLRSPVSTRSRYESVSNCALEVKQFAKRNKCAVILACQVGRAEGADGSTEIGLESARDSGQVEEAADFLVGLWRPSHRKGWSDEQRKEHEHDMRGRLLKNRRGGSFSWNFHFDARTLRIRPEEA